MLVRNLHPSAVLFDGDDEFTVQIRFSGVVGKREGEDGILACRCRCNDLTYGTVLIDLVGKQIKFAVTGRDRRAGGAYDHLIALNQGRLDGHRAVKCGRFRHLPRGALCGKLCAGDDCAGTKNAGQKFLQTIFFHVTFLSAIACLTNFYLRIRSEFKSAPMIAEALLM